VKFPGSEVWFMNHSQSNRKSKPGESGYVLIAIVGVMMFGLILTTAAAPKIQKESQREREEEMLWRGQQIAGAILRFKLARGAFPNDLNDLVQGIEIGTKKLRFLRPSALCDPMMPCNPGTSNWRLVHPGDPLPKDLLEAYIATMQKAQVQLPPPADLVAMARLGGAKLPGDVAGGNADAGNGQATGLDLDTDSGDKLKKLPVIGVVSRKDDRMFRSYYGIEEYDRALFFPQVPVIAGGFLPPLGFGTSVPAPQTDRCPDGGVRINGECYGGLRPGKCSPPRRINPQTGACE